MRHGREPPRTVAGRITAAGLAAILGACAYEAPGRERVVERRLPGDTIILRDTPPVVVTPSDEVVVKASDEVVVRPADDVVVSSANELVIQEAPPIEQHEAIVERDRPSVDHVWVGGWWHHDGRHFGWRPGRWELPPEGRTIWVPPRYERRGRGWVFVAGSWR